VVENLYRATTERGEQAADHKVLGQPRAASSDHAVAPTIGQHRIGQDEPPPPQRRPATPFPLVRAMPAAIDRQQRATAGSRQPRDHKPHPL
jgi:hypothetical protein